MATSGRRRGKERSVAKPDGKADGEEKVDQISLSTFCSPERVHLLAGEGRSSIAPASARRRR